CNRLGRNLVVIGSGPEEQRLRRLAGPTVSFLGWQSDVAVRDHLRRCRALLFPGEEEFGLVPVEAMACGAAVIAYGRGGATETVVPLAAGRSRRQGFSQREKAGGASTGVWFPEQSVDGVIWGIKAFESRSDEFNPAAARRQALNFSTTRLEIAFFDYLRGV